MFGFKDKNMAMTSLTFKMREPRDTATVSIKKIK
jgi:hypothetical protein